MVVSFCFGQCFVLCTNNQTTTLRHKNLEDSWWLMFCAYELLLIVIVAINHRKMDFKSTIKEKMHKQTRTEKFVLDYVYASELLVHMFDVVFFSFLVDIIIVIFYI